MESLFKSTIICSFSKEYICEMGKTKPRLKDYEEELHKHRMTKSQLSTEKDEFRFGTILISTKDFKKTLENEIAQWINMLTKVLTKKHWISRYMLCYNSSRPSM